jgi:HlyD family secretion protein
MKPSKWHFIGLGFIILVVAGFYITNNVPRGESSGKATPYKEFTVKRGTFHSAVSASGVVKPIDRVQIKSKASGLIEELRVEEGDYVKKGALICRLDQTDVKAEVEQAQADLDIAAAELNQAQNTYNRREQLFLKKLISKEEFDQADLLLAQAKGKMLRARTALDQANTRLSETIVRAPVDGVILQKYVEAGQIISSGISNVSGGTTIADIADMRLVEVEAGVDEIDVGKVKVRQPAAVIAEAYPQMRFSGEIIRIAPEANVVQNVTRFNVVIEVENTKGLLKSGMNATVEVTVVKEENVLLAPTLALSEPMEPGAGRNIRRALLKRGHEFVPHEVEIGLFDFEQMVVTADLKEGDILGVPMTSRLKEENDRMEERIKSTRSFGSSGPP